ncbi:MAG: hypothetical protein J6S14_14740 [Clostridia bacterium]|nr:hypothetical protein [Clostridia bacterium]
MNIPKLEKWKQNVVFLGCRTGLRVRYETNVDDEVKRACKDFANWLRRNFEFPKRVTVYVKAAKVIKSCDGEKVFGTFWGPCNKQDEPYIRIATGDYMELLNKHGKDNALAEILWCMSHELIHYLQWLNDITLTIRGLEKQASYYADWILTQYSNTRDHP